MQATWKPHEKHGELTAKGDLPDAVFAFPKQRKEPMTDAKHVRNAVARFDQVMDVSDEDRTLAFTNIKKTAEHYDVGLLKPLARSRRSSATPARKRRQAVKTKRARENSRGRRQDAATRSVKRSVQRASKAPNLRFSR
jgi:hypothetical protein